MTSLDLDRSHDPLRRSWVASANPANSDFPVQNLPFGVFREAGSGKAPRGGVAIGDHVLDVAAVSSLLGEVKPIADTLMAPDLRPLMSLAPPAWTALRLALSDLLCAENGDHERIARHLHASDGVEMFLPVRPGSFVDFFASIQHATNAGSIFRPTAPLLPNYKYVPVAYNGRASTIVVSGSLVSRPSGQTRADGQEVPSFGPSQRLDFETELGVFLGGYSEQGRPVKLREAWRHVFGFCLLNDWSARDIQAWEYQPLGPFLGKSFASTISPWVVTADALRPFRVPLRERPTGDPAPLPYLSDDQDRAAGAVDVVLETRLVTRKLRENAGSTVLGKASTRELYWSIGQMVAHLTSNGCNIEAGDLVGSGTVSGDAADALGSLLEITRAGKEPLRLPGGELRSFLEDDDEIVITGRCARKGFAPIGFGRCVGHVSASPAG